MRHRLNSEWKDWSWCKIDKIRITLQYKWRKGRILYSFLVQECRPYTTYYGDIAYSYYYIETIYNLDKLNRKYNTPFTIKDIPKLNLGL